MKGYFTIKRGKIKLTSDKQHRYMHVYHLDHTHHMSDGRVIRHRWINDKFLRYIRRKNK